MGLKEVSKRSAKKASKRLLKVGVLIGSLVGVSWVLAMGLDAVFDWVTLAVVDFFS